MAIGNEYGGGLEMQISLGEELTCRLKKGTDSLPSTLCPLGFFLPLVLYTGL